MLAAATAVMVLALAGAVVIAATYDGRAYRDSARAPVAVEDPAQATVWWMWDTAYSLDGRYVDVVHVVPLVPDAPLPPGLARWPEPGEIVPSPAVLASAGFAELARQLGASSGAVISRDGLTDDRERLIYQRPAGDAFLPDSGRLVASFGKPHGGSTGVLGSAMRTKPESLFLEAYAALVVVPALVLLLVVVRIDGRRRTRALVIARTLGADARQRAAFLLGACARPVAAGAALGAVVVTVACLVDVRLPWVDYQVRASDLRASGAALVGAVVGAVLVVVGVLLLAHRARLGASAVRPEPRSVRVTPAALALFPLVVVGVDVAYSSAKPLGANVTTLVYYAGVLGVVVVLPFFVAATTRVVARGLVRVGRRRGSPSVIDASRQLLADAGGVLRLAAALAVVIVLASQVQIWSSKLSAQAMDAARLERVVGTAVATLDIPGDVAQQRRAVPVLNRHGHVVVLAGSDAPGAPPPRMFASCAGLRAVELDCREGVQQLTAATRAFAAAVSLNGDDAVRVVPGDPVIALGGAGDSGWRTALLVSPDGSDLPIAEVNADLSALSAPAPVVGRLSESWTWAANDGVDKAAWLTLFGAWAVALLSLALGGAGLAEQLDMARGVRAWAAMGAGARTIWGRTGWRMLTPLALAMAAGVAATVGLARPITAPGEGGSLPASTLLATCILAPLASLALWAAASSLAVRDLNVWRPPEPRAARVTRSGGGESGVEEWQDPDPAGRVSDARVG